MPFPFAHPLLRRLAVILGLTVYVAAASTIALAQTTEELPDIGNPAGTILSKDDEYSLGLMVLRELRQQNEILDDPESAEYVQALGSRIAAQAPESAHQFVYSIVRERDINAFAVPGGFIFLNYGTILASGNESQLAGVLAHETAHVVQRHIARAIRAQSRQSITTAAAILAAILLGAMGGGGAAVEGGIAAAEGMAAQQQINFTRGEEYEADRVGMGFLARAGFDPEGMPDFFEALEHRVGVEEVLIPKILVDHPATADRIAEAKGRAAQLERPKHLQDSVSYALIRERVRVLMADPDTDMRDFYRRRLETRYPLISDQYGEALAQMRSGHPAEAVEILRPLVAAHDSVILLHSALGEAQVAAGQMQQGLSTFARAEALFPRNVPLSVRYGEALIKAGHGKEAHELLLDVFNNAEPTPQQIQLTARAASAAGDPGDAYYYMSEYHITSGNLNLASHQLELALSTPNLTIVQRERYRARLDEIREFLAEERRAHHGRQTADNDGSHLEEMR